MKRFLCVFLSMVMVGTLLSGCVHRNVESVGYDLSAAVQSLDPQAAENQDAMIVMSALFDGLYRMTPSGKLEKAMALSETVSPDGLSYTFTLRKDAKWFYRTKDDEEKQIPVTAADFVFAFRRLFSSNTHSAAASRFTCIKNAQAALSGKMSPASVGVYADGDAVLRFELSSKNDNFLNLLSTVYAVPCNQSFFEQTMGRYGLDAQTVASNGPFQIAKWNESTGITLKKNNDYYAKDHVNTESVALYFGKNLSGDSDDDGDEVKRLKKGTVDAALLGGEQQKQISHFPKQPVENTVWGLCFNEKNSGFANVNIRKAISLAFDRASYQKNLSGNLSVAFGIVPHDAMLFGKSFRSIAGENAAPSFNGQEAYRVCQKGLSGLDATELQGIRLLVSSDTPSELIESFHTASQVLQQELSLFISIDSVSADEYTSRLTSGNYDVALVSFVSTDNTPYSVLSSFKSGNSGNIASYQSKEFDTALSMAVAAPSQEESEQQYRSAEQILLRDAAFIPMCYAKEYFVTRPDTSDITYNKQNGLIDFTNAGA